MMFRPLIAISAALLLLSGCATTRAGDQPDKTDKLADIHYQLGIDALTKPGMLPKAFDELMESNSLKPNQPQVLDALAYAWLLRGDLAKSESYYRSAIRHGGGAATHNNYANLLNRMERFSEAEAQARKALEDPRYPNQHLVFINLGDAQLGQKQYDKAIASYQQAQMFNSDSLVARIRIAQAHARANRLGQASALYQAIYATENNNRAVVEGWVEVLLRQHQQSQALHILKEYAGRNIPLLDRAWAQQKADEIRRP